MKQYIVKDEFVEYWGDEAEIILDMIEIVRLSKEWDVPLEELMAQVEEY